MFSFRPLAASIGAVALTGMVAASARAAVGFSLIAPITTASQSYVGEERGSFAGNGATVETGYTGGGSLFAATRTSEAFGAAVNFVTALRLASAQERPCSQKPTRRLDPSEADSGGVTAEVLHLGSLPRDFAHRC